MAATDGQIILAASRFGDTIPVYLRDFSKQQLPAVAKIVKGQHQNLGVPTLSNPSLQSTALFLSAGKKYQILAQPIKIKEGRKPTNVGAKVLIPETYPGFFELLSEDGRSTRCIDSVLELSKRRNLRVLVRETFRCTQMNKTIHAGELLTTMNEHGKYLQCRTIKDEIVNLPLETKAKFSPIAKEDSISGVHSVKNLLLKRMPVIVRLVHGSAPKGLKQPFVPELRLLGCVEIDRVFALPLQKDTDLVPVPLNAKIKLQRSKNMEQLEHFIEYSRFLDKAQRLLSDARDRLQIVDMKLSEKEKKDSKFSSRNKLPTVLTASSAGVLENGYVLRKSASLDSYNKQQLQSNSQIADEYNEIDHIYDYVRGLTPLSKGLTRFEPICESPTLKSQATTDSGNYCSLIRVSSTSNSHNNNISSNNNNNNNYSSLESNKHNSSHHSSSNHHHNHNHNNNNHHHHHHSTSASHQQHNHNSNHSSNSNSNNNHNHNQSQQIHPQLQSSQPQIIHLQAHYNHSHIQEDIKPVPPPIETIPGKKLPEKRQRPTLPKLYVKNNSSSSSHHSKVLSNSPNLVNGNSPISAAINGNKDCGLEPQSPLFHIRYKSLSSLQLTPDSNSTTPISTTPKGNQQQQQHLQTTAQLPMPLQQDVIKSSSNNNIHNINNNNNANANNNNNNNNNQLLSKSASSTGGAREGTLDSSRSGGRTSGDSKLPEKKTRRLSRPRSLSNLVWDLRPSKEKSKKKLYIHHFDHRQQATLYL
ncbi:transcription factor mef2A [Eupeodes corollae]|uniref:transcription factor mef2A n=1 Tax=Eupeodes corollae TaxID=290404 RepID=UPI002490EB1B|nr:transcription factor mef2A [Eupeodes corollae]XP_055915909.1 transcription factor mef2A [Eupeodes corollae]XP_055915910.1 transcription factor mef2A [Eupeodes corollae]XP_055915911.1 transcription factor mef2A [Eupeodes corollae]XP_055915912.1 transcription factor mef2A [Eupeodes corollae]